MKGKKFIYEEGGCLLLFREGQKVKIQKRNAKGEGSFKENENGTITHRKCVGYKYNGRRKVFTVTAANKAACIKQMRKKEREWERYGKESPVENLDTVVTLCEKHLKYQIDNEELKPKSIDRRECTINYQIRGYDFGNLQIHTVKPLDIERYVSQLLREKKVGESSIIKAIDVVNAAFEWAVLNGSIERNPVSTVKKSLIKKVKKVTYKGADDADVTVLSDEEIIKFRNEALKAGKNGNLVYSGGYYCLLLLYTGLRVGEMLALRWRDWDGNLLRIDKSISMAKNRNKKNEHETNYIHIEGTTKNQKARTIELMNEAKWVLQMIKQNREFCSDNDFITLTSTGRVNSASNLEHRMKVIMKHAGLSDVKGGLHIFRKTFATRLYEQGARVADIAAYIGDLESTTSKYYIAIRKKVLTNGNVHQVVKLPGMYPGESTE